MAFAAEYPFLNILGTMILLIDKGKSLLDSGAINQAEFDAIKAKALA